MMFYRINENGNAQIFENDGDIVTRIDANVYPVDSQLSTRYEHASGIVLTIEDAEKLGIHAEF
jgi:hypothetical protein